MIDVPEPDHKPHAKWEDVKTRHYLERRLWRSRISATTKSDLATYYRQLRERTDKPDALIGSSVTLDEPEPVEVVQ